MPETIERTDLSVSVNEPAVAGATKMNSISTRGSRSKAIKIAFLIRIRQTAPEIDVLKNCRQNTIVYQSRHYVRNIPVLT
jgi:hypothetical protein